MDAADGRDGGSRGGRSGSGSSSIVPVAAEPARDADEEGVRGISTVGVKGHERQQQPRREDFQGKGDGLNSSQLDRGPPRLRSLALESRPKSLAGDGDSIRSSGTIGQSGEGDVCYSPHTRRPADSAVDHRALNEYLAVGEVEGAQWEMQSDAAALWHITRRDSKGYTSRKPHDEPQRFTLYSRTGGICRANNFAALSGINSSASVQTLDGRENVGRLKSLSDLIKAGDFWLDVISPTAGELKAFSKIFGIHPLTVEDIEMREDREKCEVFQSYYFVCFRTFDQDQYSPTFMLPVVYYVVVLNDGVLSFHFMPTPHEHNVLSRIEALHDHMCLTPDWICYALIDDIADSFGPVIRQLEAEAVSIDELVLILKENEQCDMLQRIGHARRNVMTLLRLMNAKPDVIKVLSKRVVKSSDIALYYGDIQDHLLSMLSSLNYFEGILGRSHSNYLAQISIEITRSSNQTNAVLNKITIIGSILVPMNVVTGLWGMNVPVPGGPDGGSYAWFFGIVAFLCVFSLVSVVGLRRYQAL